MLRKCDRCGKETDWDVDHKAGNCINCGDDLCGFCAVSWNDKGECKRCEDVKVKQ
jgi:hypothetical protein